MSFYVDLVINLVLISTNKINKTIKWKKNFIISV